MGVMTAYYDLQCNLPSYDVVTFLMMSEHERIRRGADEIEIEILPGPHEGFIRSQLWPPTLEGKRNMLNRVVVPMCKMLCQRVIVRQQRPTPVHSNSFGFGTVTLHMKGFLAAYAAGIRPLRLKEEQKPSRLITMTLRECDHWPARNSRTAEWIKAALSLQQMGHEILVIRDTNKADEPLHEMLTTAPVASRDLDARAALYRRAACNVFVSNGPAWFALALDAPVLMLRPACDSAGSLARHSAMAAAGLPAGAQLPNHSPHHQLVWEDDTSLMICSSVFRFTDKRMPRQCDT